MFRGKESSNRIKLSRLVQDLLNFGVLGSLQLWGSGGGSRGGWGVPPTHVHLHACTHMYAQARVANMIMSCKWLLPLDFWGIPGNSLWCHAHAHVCMCTCVGGTLSPPPPPPPCPHPPGGILGISQNSRVLELIKIFQFCLKIWNLCRLPHQWVGV